MVDWLHRIPLCFDPVDLVFAGTPDEAMFAKRLRADIEQAELPRAVVESAFEDWLHQETSNTGQLFEQMGRVRAFFGY